MLRRFRLPAYGSPLSPVLAAPSLILESLTLAAPCVESSAAMTTGVPTVLRVGVALVKLTPRRIAGMHFAAVATQQEMGVGWTMFVNYE